MSVSLPSLPNSSLSAADNVFSLSGAVEDGGREISPLRVFEIWSRRKYGILLTGVVLSVITLLLVSMLPSHYTTTAAVLVEDRKPNFTDLPASGGSAPTDAVAVRTQVDILRSSSLARTIAHNLHLAGLPEFSPHDGLLSRLLQGVGLAERPALASAGDREEIASQILAGMVSIVNDGRSYVVGIQVTGAARSGEGERVRALTAEIANAYANTYVQMTRTVKTDHISQANGLFDDRLAALQQKVQAAETAVQSYRVANGLVEDRVASAAGRSVTVVGQQLAQLNANLMVAVADRAQKEASLDAVTHGGGLAAAPEVVASPLVQRLLEQQAEIASKSASASAIHGSAYPDVGALRASERDIAGKIAAETGRVAASLGSAVVAARARESSLRAQLAQLQSEVSTQAQTEIRLNELQNEAESARQIYSNYLKRAQETANEAAMQEPDAMVVSRAALPLAPTAPTPRQFGVAGVILSFLIAGLLALVRERMASGIRTAEEAEASMGVGVLGLIPQAKRPLAALRFERGETEFAEAISSARSLLRLNMRQGAQVVMVTSALPQEGKTFCALALARNAAMAGERVLLIDCDLRRPARAGGVATIDDSTLDCVVEIDAHTEMAIWRDSLSSLVVTPFASSYRSPQDLFASPRMRELMEIARERYDLIVLDAPAVLEVTDARILAGLADLSIMVVCWQKTSKQHVVSAIQVLRNSGSRVAGALLNQAKTSRVAASDGGFARLQRRHDLGAVART